MSHFQTFNYEFVSEFITCYTSELISKINLLPRTCQHFFTHHSEVGAKYFGKIARDSLPVGYLCVVYSKYRAV